VLVLIGEGHQLGLDAGAVARTYALYLAVVEGRVRQPSPQALVDGFVGISNPAGKRLSPRPPYKGGSYYYLSY
jgi:hypothetical protein